MGLNSLLKERLEEWKLVARTPVIIESVEGRFRDILEIFKLPDVAPRHTIRAFDQISVSIPNRTIEDLAKETDIIQTIYFDDVVPLPPTPPSSRQRLITSSDLLSAAGVDIPGGGKLGMLTGVNSRVVFNRVRARVTRLGRPSIPEPGWVPTSAVRALVGADVARADGIEGRLARLAIVDSGTPTGIFLPGHPTLSGRITPFYLGMFPRPDRVGHGSHVASIAGGRLFEAPNGLVTEGIAPGSAMGSFKVLQTRLGVGRNSDILKGLEMAMQWNATLINMSLGSDTFVPDSPFEGPFQTLIANGIIPVAAAGNSGPGASTVGTPGGSPWAITVGSVSTKGVPSGFSSRGPAGSNVKPDVASYGGDDVTNQLIYTGTSGGSTIDGLDNNKFDELGPAEGTSMACPAAVGTFALWDEWLQVNRNRRLSFQDIKTVLQTKGGTKNNNVGWGIPKYDWVKVL